MAQLRISFVIDVPEYSTFTSFSQELLEFSQVELAKQLLPVVVKETQGLPGEVASLENVRFKVEIED